MLLFTDLETTGLDPRTEDVLEIAAILTTDDLTEIARFHRIVYSTRSDTVYRHCAALVERTPPDVLEADDPKVLGNRSLWRVPGIGVSPVVVKMHWDNGLWAESRRGENIATVDQDLVDFVRTHSLDGLPVTLGDDAPVPPKFVRPQLAGSTISFDREFLRAAFPRTTDEEYGVLHYRNLDVSTMNELARRWWPALHEARPGQGKKSNHRGVGDIENSLAVIKYYLDTLKPVAAVAQEAA